jgi:hypothetical protein
MNWNKLVLSGVLGALVMVVIGYIWHVPLFGGFYNEQWSSVARPELILWVAVLGEILRGFLLAYIYPIGYKGGQPSMEGLRFGVLLGLFAAMLSLIYFGVFNFASAAWFWAEAAYAVIQTGAAGVVIGLAYGTQAGKAA